MASLDRYDFEARTRRLIGKHTNMANGYKTKVQRDGLIVVKPKRKNSPISMRSFAIFLIAFFAFKGFLIANLGEQTYGERVAQLGNGTSVEKAGAMVMQPDVISQYIAQAIGPILR